MTSRQAIFGIANEDGDDNEKLVELFKNRAELKKEFAALRRENDRLQQLVGEERGATARITQRLQHLEGLLTDPQWVDTVVVFYQLRSLNRRCRGKLVKFAEQLKQQRERRGRDVQLQTWRDKLNARKAAAGEKLDAQRERLRLLEGQLQSERQRAESMSGLSRLFKGRATSDQFAELNEQLDEARNAEQALLQDMQAIETAAPPDPPGLSIAEKRSINFMIIAFAQHLYLQFGDRDLVALVKESGDKSAGAINYGSKRDCDLLLGRIAAHIDSMEESSDYADVLKRRADLIAEHAAFEEDGDAAPIAETVSTLFAINADGGVNKSDLNLVGDNYWGISKVLSR